MADGDPRTRGNIGRSQTLRLTRGTQARARCCGHHGGAAASVSHRLLVVPLIVFAVMGYHLTRIIHDFVATLCISNIPGVTVGCKRKNVNGNRG